MIILPNTQQQNNSVYRYLPPQAILPEPHYPGPVQLNGINNIKLFGQPTYSALEGTQRTQTNPGEQYYSEKEGTQMTPAGYSIEEISSSQERVQPFINQGGIQGFPDPHYDLYSNVYPIESLPGIVIFKNYDKNSFIKFSICYITINLPVGNIAPSQNKDTSYLYNNKLGIFVIFYQHIS